LPAARYFANLFPRPRRVRVGGKPHDVGITETDWEIARRDVQRFLPLREQEALRLWERKFFLHHLGVLAEYIVAS
jgi:hypothetical protein